MKVSDVMMKDPVVVNPKTTCARIARLMKDRKIGSVVLVEGGKPVGIVTEMALVHRIMAEKKDQNTSLAEDVATKPVIAVSIQADVEMAVDIMNDYNIRRIARASLA
jgi:CBS domain-containing protein